MHEPLKPTSACRLEPTDLNTSLLAVDGGYRNVGPNDPLAPLASVLAMRDSVVVQAAKAERYWLHHYTHEGALRYLKLVVNRGDSLGGASTRGEVKADLPVVVGPLAPPPLQTSLVGTSLSSVSRTPLEDLRHSLGLVETWKEVFAKLAGRIRLMSGLEKLDRWTTKNLGGRRCQTMAQARELFPNLTAVEIAFLSLVRGIPPEFTKKGIGFDRVRSQVTESDETVSSGAGIRRKILKSMVPQQLAMRPDGVLYGDSASVLVSGLREMELEVTNPEDATVMPFLKREIGEEVRLLVSLSISSPRIFEKLRESITDALNVGIGLIRREALKRVYAEYAVKAPTPSPPKAPEPQSVVLKGEMEIDSDEQVAFSLEKALPLLRAADAGTLGPRWEDKLDSLDARIQGLSPELSAAFTQEESEIARRLYAANLVDDNGHEIKMEELVKLVGLLDQIPRCLLQAEPFKGRVVLHGSYLIFADTSETIQETCRLGLECQRHLRLGTYDEEEDISLTNRSMHEVELQLRADFQTGLFGPIIAADEASVDYSSCSIMEEVALKVYRKYGIALIVLGDRGIEVLGCSSDSRLGSPISGGLESTFSMKFGRDECLLVERILDRFGAKGLQNVKVIRKQQSDKIEDRALDLGEFADLRYDKKSQTLFIVEPRGSSYDLQSGALRDNRSFELARALANVHWQHFDASQLTFWSDVHRRGTDSEQAAETVKAAIASGSAEAKAALKANTQLIDLARPAILGTTFLWPYATDNPMLDFCGHFACYIVAFKEFEGAAARNTLMKEKFDWIAQYANSLGINSDKLRADSVATSSIFGGSTQALMKLLREIFASP